MLAAKDILKAALELDSTERSRLVDELSASLHGIELSADWEEEIERRISDIDSGQVKTIPGDEVFARLEQRYSGR